MDNKPAYLLTAIHLPRKVTRDNFSSTNVYGQRSFGNIVGQNRNSSSDNIYREAEVHDLQTAINDLLSDPKPSKAVKQHNI